MRMQKLISVVLETNVSRHHFGPMKGTRLNLRMMPRAVLMIGVESPVGLRVWLLLHKTKKSAHSVILTRVFLMNDGMIIYIQEMKNCVLVYQKLFLLYA